MRATLRYTDCLQDGKNVFMALARKNVEILRTMRGFSIYPRVTILINDRSELNKLLDDLNNTCKYEVSLEKICKSRRCDYCNRKDCCSVIHKALRTIKDFFISLVSKPSSESVTTMEGRCLQ